MGALDGISHDEVLKLALFAGKLLLENGDSTACVEEKMLLICYGFGIRNINVFITPNFIIIGDNMEVGKNLTYRIPSHGRNLSVVCAVNKFICSIDEWNMDFDATMKYLESLSVKPYGDATICFASGLAAGFFALLFDGSVFDFFGGFAVGLLTMVVSKTLKIGRYSGFWDNCASGIAMGLLAFFVCKFCPKCNLDIVTVGAIMPFVPGLIFTNGLQDAIAGDLISGNSRMSEALMLVLALVAGLGCTLLIALHR